MSRYIDIEPFENNPPFLNDDEYDPYVLVFNSGVTACQKFIDELPTADVQEIKHGKWNKDGYDVICSNCGYIESAPKPYCSDCGAKMIRSEQE